MEEDQKKKIDKLLQKYEENYKMAKEIQQRSEYEKEHPGAHDGGDLIMLIFGVVFFALVVLFAYTGLIEVLPIVACAAICLGGAITFTTGLVVVFIAIDKSGDKSLHNRINEYKEKYLDLARSDIDNQYNKICDKYRQLDELEENIYRDGMCEEIDKLCQELDEMCEIYEQLEKTQKVYAQLYEPGKGLFGLENQRISEKISEYVQKINEQCECIDTKNEAIDNKIDEICKLCEEIKEDVDKFKDHPIVMEDEKIKKQVDLICKSYEKADEIKSKRNNISQKYNNIKQKYKIEKQKTNQEPKVDIQNSIEQNDNGLQHDREKQNDTKEMRM